MRSNIVCLVGLLWTTSLGLAPSARAREADVKAACSVHFRWPAPTAEWFYHEATVRKSTTGSYFMVCGWNTGYFGIQELGDGKKVAIFSVWDQTKGDNPDAVAREQRVEILQQGRGVEVSRFGGEGTGGKCMMPFNWKSGRKVRCFVQCAVEGNKTAYAGWLWMPNQKSWKHLVTFRVTTGGQPLSGLYSFVEDFRRDTGSVKDDRVCEFGNGWVKATDGKVQPLPQGTFSASTSKEEAQDLINAGNVPGGLFLATGGKVRKMQQLETTLNITPVPSAPPDDLPTEAKNTTRLPEK